MEDALHAIEWDIWLISVDQEDINQIWKEMLFATIVIDPVILPDSAEVRIRTIRVRYIKTKTKEKEK